MKLLRVGERGSEIPVILDGTDFLDARSVMADITPEFLASDGMSRLRNALLRGELPIIELPLDIRIGAPLSRAGAVITVATNYHAHANEAGRPIPDEPVIILKAPSSLTGPFDSVFLPAGSVRLDWEAELGVVIGSPCFLLEEEDDALARIAGFVIADDVAERDYQFVGSGNQWGKGKSYPSFTPIGPWLVTPDEIDHRHTAITTKVNGEQRQQSSTADMIFDATELVSYVSRFMALEPGDLILTGTPEGVALSGRFPYLVEGDVIEIELTGLGVQRSIVSTA